MNNFKTRVVERFYLHYFFYSVIGFSVRKKYILIDIDNTVNDQAARLLRYVRDGVCNYKLANRLSELVSDVPLPGSVDIVKELSKHFRIVWLTARGARMIPATYYWLRKNRFPVHALICTGSTIRKINFIELFIKNHSVGFVVDDMKEGYEYGNPEIVFPYKEYLRLKNIEVFEDLFAARLGNKFEENDV